MKQTQVVVTGIGIISPLGLNTEHSWKSLISGKSGINLIKSFDTTGFETRVASEVNGFNPEDYMDRKEARRMDRFSQFALAASREAAAHAGLTVTDLLPERVGVIIGSGIGGILTLSEQFLNLYEKGPSRISPFLATMMLVDMAASQVSIALGAKGPNFSVVSACASGSDAIGQGFEMIKRGEVDVVIAGGTEAPICPISISGFSACRALSMRNDDPTHASRPFDLHRDGFVMGEGSAILVLERLEHSVARNAKPIAELIGYAATSDANHITQPIPGGEGGARAMNLAINRSGIETKDIDYINAHGTSTPLNDKAETDAIKTVFGEEAYKIPISSTKSMTGHLMGAAGAMEAAVCALSIRDGVIHPTLNLMTPDPDCDLDYTPWTPRRGPVDIALSNSLGFGGHNSALIFRRV